MSVENPYISEMPKTAASSEPNPALRKGQILAALKKLKLRKEELNEALHHVRETETFLREEYTLITRREAEANAQKLEAVETVEKQNRKLLQKVASQLREKDLADLMEEYTD